MDILLNQTAIWEPQEPYPISPNSDGEPVYGAPVFIKCRRETSIRRYEQAGGDLLKNTTEYYTTQEIKIDDKLDGQLVKFTEHYADLSGIVIGYRSVI